MTLIPTRAAASLPDYHTLGLGPVVDKLQAGQRLSLEDGERLLACPDPLAVGRLAHAARTARHGLRASYVVNRHVNVSNICVGTCRFCAFRKSADDPEAYVLDLDAVRRLILETPEDLAELHVVGGCHPDLGVGFYEEILDMARKLRPGAVRKCLSAVEIAHLAALEHRDPAWVLTRLKDAGLQMLPGGGAEIFAPQVRQKVCPDKLSGTAWLAVHRVAHGLGIRSNATMLFGHVETPRQRIEHLDALRRLQDETGGFTCFIALPFLARNNPLADNGLSGPDGLDILRTIATARLMLDNIAHIKAYWVMLGPGLAQTALAWGADDLDGTVIEERIARSAGADSGRTLTRHGLEDLLREGGFTPVQRDGWFRPLHAEPAESGSAQEVRA